MPSVAECLAAAGAAFGAGVVNAVAGGGTLISFPTLVALGVPAVHANVTNTVSLCPGYIGGAVAQRHDLGLLARHLRSLGLLAAAGGLTGSVLLVASPERFFRGVVPFLILAACGLLLAQDPLKRRIAARRAAGPGAAGPGAAATAASPSTAHPHSFPLLAGSVFAASVYGGYFGAGLGIMLLAVLGLALDEPLVRVNALKQALSVVINVLAALFFVASGKVEWVFAAVMAPAALAGGTVGGRLVGLLRPAVMRAIVVGLGVAVAIRFWA